ncbi:MAG: RDD family protein [Nitrospirota bacterium]
MLCPKCSFTTFDYADTCKKCGYDLKAHRESKGIQASKPVSMPALKPEKKIEAAPIDFEFQTASKTQEEAFTIPSEPSSDEGFAAPPPPISDEPISEPAYESLPAYPDAESLPKGGFWIRFAAVFVDGIILLIVQGIFVFFVGMGVGMGSIMRGGIPDEGQMLSGIIAFFVTIFIGMAYHIFFVGWRGQTPGKMALKLKIIQTNGEEMTYGKAFLRWVGYSISGLTLGIGYLMVAFTKQKQGLHDKIAGTYVIRL